ncbi:MAG: hypothetical protein AAF394_13420, partial [Planctomycetota bacterium]
RMGAEYGGQIDFCMGNNMDSMSPRYLRLAAILAFCTLLHSSVIATAQEIRLKKLDTPQTLYATDKKVEVRSGPGEDYYATSQTTKGDSFKAFSQTTDGWYGIQPPNGSFSWVRAKDAYLLPGGKVIEATDSEAVSWIGTSLGTAKQFRWQVKLQQGEQLTVLGESTQKDSEGNPVLWYRVAPPSGEFRWVHESHVTLDAKEVANTASPASAAEQNSGDVVLASAETSSGLAPASYQENGSEAEEVAPTEEPAENGVFDDLPPKKPGSILENPEEIVAEEYLGDEIYEGEIIVDDGSVFYEDGGVVYEDGGVIYEEAAKPKRRWDGWHAFELGDDGLRCTWLERLIGRRGPMQDPLSHDPFSLKMPKPVRKTAQVRPRIVQPAYESRGQNSTSGYVPPQPLDRLEPWRDPNLLEQNRLRGYPQAGAESERRPPLTARLRDSLSRLGSGFGRQADPLATGGFATRPNAIDTGIGMGSSVGNSALLASNASSPPQASAGNGSFDWYGVKDSSVVQAATPASDLSVSSELDQLQLALSEMVTKPTGQWNLEPLRSRATQFVEHGATPIERGQARLLLERIDEFQQHAHRSAFVPGANLRASRPTSPAPSVTTASFVPRSSSTPAVSTAAYQSPTSSPSSTNLNSFTATGYLVQTVMAGPGQPTHALTDQQGQVIAYVSGLPGMNLNLNLNQPVGIKGLRGYLPQLQKAHVRAERIVRLK